MSVWLRTAGLAVQVDGDEPWTELVRESCAGQELEEPPVTPDVHVMVTRDADVGPGSGHRLVTRGAWSDGREVVLADACSSGLDVAVRPSAVRLEVLVRPHRGWRHRALGMAAPDRQVLLQRAVLVQYPALWWAGTRGHVPMHVSAASVDGYAVVLAGPGGVGKSTLVATLDGPTEAPVSDNLCVSDGRVVHGLLEPTRAEGGTGRRMPHGRRESGWARRVESVRPDAVLVLSRGERDEVTLTRTDPDAAARELTGGTYAAGELRRYWAYAATLALGTGRGPAHPPVADVADALATSVPVLDVHLPRSPGTTLRDLVGRARALARPEEVGRS
jgi:hypothetical protein